MDVPRCDKCRFWMPGGECRVFSDDPNIAVEDQWALMQLPTPKAVVVPFAGADGGCFITHEDFGCVQFEGKD